MTIRNAKSGNRTKNRIRDEPENLWMNLYVNTNSTALSFFQFDYQKFKNWKPDKKPDPGKTGKFYGLMFMSIQIHLHRNFSDLIIRSTKTGNRTENRTLVRKFFSTKVADLDDEFDTLSFF